jgi:glycosyltransferase involved in cell wall biosynthesis
MKAAIYNSYLDTLGGGERYTMAFAGVLANAGYQVEIEWKDSKILKLLEERFGLDLERIKVVNDIKRGDGYDVCFWVSDGSIPTLRARKNFLHFQVPFQNVGGRSLLNKMKLFRVNKIICNSNFTKRIIDREYGVNSMVIYPPVDTMSIKPKRKDDLILYVGRFSKILQSKSQDVLIKTFKKMYDGSLVGWKLVLAGGVEIGVGDYVKKLSELAEGYPVEIIESPGYKTLRDLYGKARIFWSASGFGENENKNPEKVEHFGITVVEAMTGGVVPVVYDAGGHKEIVKEGINGFLWSSVGNLVSRTKNIISDKKLWRQLSLQAQKDSLNFSLDRFNKEVWDLI